MNFSQALDRIKWGQPMSREAWQDVARYVHRLLPPDEDKLALLDNGVDALWSPSIEDIMATDWVDVLRID